jgi:hypothetical protein
MEKLKKLTSMGYLTYGSAVTPKDILLSPYRLWSDTGMLDIKTWGCFAPKHPHVVQSPIKRKDCRPIVFC